MNNPKVSIIIPVYNTGEYLYECIYSVLNQSLKEIEIIIINDGSTDNSGEICEYFARIDSRIKVIHNDNRGVSASRNLGISLSNGKYTCFIDSDDFIDINMLEKLYKKAELYECDMVYCDLTIKYPNFNINDTISSLEKSVLLEKDNISPDVLMEIAGSMCRGIYKRELLIINNILCPTNLKLSEDRVFNLNFMGSCQTLFYLKEPLYYQNVRETSVTHKYFDNMWDMVKQSRKCILGIINEKWSNKEEIRSIYNNQFYNGMIGAINNELHVDNKISIIKKYLKVKKIINDPVSKLIINNKRFPLIVKHFIYNNTIILFILIKFKKIIQSIRRELHV